MQLLKVYSFAFHSFGKLPAESTIRPQDLVSKDSLLFIYEVLTVPRCSAFSILRLKLTHIPSHVSPGYFSIGHGLTLNHSVIVSIFKRRVAPLILRVSLILYLLDLAAVMLALLLS